MSSIGEFREGEIDGKPFHIFTFQSQSDILTSSSSSGVAAIDSGGDADLSLEPLFLCPKTRYRLEASRRKKNGIVKVDDDSIPFNTSPHYPNTDQQVQSLIRNHLCIRPIKLLFWCNEKVGDKCASCIELYTDTAYYFCGRCGDMFHKECVEAPLKLKHPSYPSLSLQLYSCRYVFDHDRLCNSCEKRVVDIFYYCPTYNLVMHPFCAMKPIPIFIDHPKRHPHSLTFFPKQNSLVCNICGVIKQRPTYVCARCAFVVHEDCIYFPYVVRISRHRHRISFIISLPSGIWSCGVCRQKVDNSCGAYSCNSCPDYFVHTRCALRRDLWDGEELEGVPEEPEIVVEPFEKICEGVIRHFSHAHHLKLEISGDYDDEKFCQGCALPIYEGNYYSCMDQCNFILHEACASSPLKTYHPLHHQPLMLKVVTKGYDYGEGRFNCSACRRQGTGFVYQNSLNNKKGFKLDLRCASISEPFKYEGHAHPLFLALTPEEEKSAICQICQDTGSTRYCCRKLNCIDCDFIICFRCATLPFKARYKHDKHFITFRKAKEASDESGWCEVCERKIVYSGKGGFYMCDDYCCTTLHVHCLLGTDPYMKPGQAIYFGLDVFRKVRVCLNNTMSRPMCEGRNCEQQCIYRTCFKKEKKEYWHAMTFCSYNCARSELAER